MQRNHRPHGPAFLKKHLTYEEVLEHRNVFCGLYGICLEVAVKRRWPSFTCLPCSLWSRNRRDLEQTGPAQVLAMPATGRR